MNLVLFVVSTFPFLQALSAKGMFLLTLSTIKVFVLVFINEIESILAMCTRPIQITRTSRSGKISALLVPCGKCAECRAAYQSEFSALSALEAISRGSLHFFTLTYNDTNLPIARIRYEFEDDYLFSTFEYEDFRGSMFPSSLLRYWSQFGCCPTSSLMSPDLDNYCPTLRRKDVQLWLKKYRSYCDRHSLPKDFAFTCFGEYGEKRQRPHYHVLVAGLSDSQANILSNLWTLGFCQVKSIPRFNKDGSDAFVLTSNYVSKYISKCDALPDFVKDGLVELPRRQSSIGFGKNKVNLDSIRPFLFSGGLQESASRREASRNSQT